MRFKTIRSIVFVLLALNLGSALAFITGSILLTNCRHAIKLINNDGYPKSMNYDQVSSAGLCVGYIGGTADYLFLTKTICIPLNSTYEQDIRIVIKYLNDNPDKLNLSSSVLIYSALYRAFPCAKIDKK